MALYSHFVGRIGSDAKIKPTKSGGKVLVMDVATDYYDKGENKTMWVRVISNKDRYIEKLSQYLTKGKLIMVQGQQIESSNWIGKADGQPHSQVAIVADLIDFVRSGGKRQEDGAQNRDGQGQTVTTEGAQQENPFPAPEGSADDLPF